MFSGFGAAQQGRPQPSPFGQPRAAAVPSPFGRPPGTAAATTPAASGPSSNNPFRVFGGAPCAAGAPVPTATAAAEGATRIDPCGALSGAPANNAAAAAAANRFGLFGRRGAVVLHAEDIAAMARAALAFVELLDAELHREARCDAAASPGVVPPFSAQLVWLGAACGTPCVVCRSCCDGLVAAAPLRALPKPLFDCRLLDAAVHGDINAVELRIRVAASAPAGGYRAEPDALRAAATAAVLVAAPPSADPAPRDDDDAHRREQAKAAWFTEAVQRVGKRQATACDDEVRRRLLEQPKPQPQAPRRDTVWEDDNDYDIYEDVGGPIDDGVGLRRLIILAARAAPSKPVASAVRGVMEVMTDGQAVGADAQSIAAECVLHKSPAMLEAIMGADRGTDLDRLQAAAATAVDACRPCCLQLFANRGYTDAAGRSVGFPPTPLAVQLACCANVNRPDPRAARPAAGQPLTYDEVRAAWDVAWRVAPMEGVELDATDLLRQTLMQPLTARIVWNARYLLTERGASDVHPEFGPVLAAVSQSDLQSQGFTDLIALYLERGCSTNVAIFDKPLLHWLCRYSRAHSLVPAVVATGHIDLSVHGPDAVASLLTSLQRPRATGNAFCAALAALLEYASPFELTSLLPIVVRDFDRGLHLGTPSNQVTFADVLAEFCNVCAMLHTHGVPFRHDDTTTASALHVVTKPEYVRVLVECGADVNAVWVTGDDASAAMRPLTAQLRHPEIVEQLLQHGAALNCCGCLLDACVRHLTPPVAHLGTQSDTCDALAVAKVLRQLLERGVRCAADAPGHAEAPPHDPPVFMALSHLPALAVLCEFGCDVNTPRRSDGAPPVHVLCQAPVKPQMLARAIELLASAGADLDAPHPATHATPLQVCVAAANNTAVRALLQHGAKPNNAWVPDGGAADPPLHSACHSTLEACSDAAMALIEHGADVNARNAAGRTPLHELCSRNGGAASAVLLNTLLAKGGDVNAAALDGSTPLHVAVTGSGKRHPMIPALAAAGADVNVADAAGYTPLMRACELLHPPSVRALLAAGARASTATASGASEARGPLLIALQHCADGGPASYWLPALLDLVKHGATLPPEETWRLQRLRTLWHPEPHDAVFVDPHYDQAHTLLQLLLDGGASVHGRRTPDDATLLHQACTHSNVKLARLLLERGADAMATGTNGDPADVPILRVATEHNDTAAAIVGIFVERFGVDPAACVTDASGTTKALAQIACERKQFSLLLALRSHGAAVW